MAQKFILQNNEFIYGDVGFHYMLAKPNSYPIGGGRWFIDVESNSLYLYDGSTDFGKVSEQELKDVVMNGIIPDELKSMRILYSPLYWDLSDIKDWTTIKEETK